MDRCLGPRELWQLARRAFKAWADDGAASMGAALAFYTLFSLAPLLLVAIAIAGLFMGRHDAQDEVISQVASFIGERAADGVEGLLDAAGSRREGVLATIAGFATLMLGATTVFAELRSDLDRIWRHPAPPASGALGFVRTRLLAFAMVMGMGVLLLASVGISTALAAAGRAWWPQTEIIAHALDFAGSLVVVTALFAMIYKMLPSAPIAWGDVWVGAGVTSVLFWIGKILISLYIGKAAIASAFGAAGALVVIVVWTYYSAQVFFLGAEFTREFALHHGSRKGLAVAANSDFIAADPLVERARRIVRGDDAVLK